MGKIGGAAGAIVLLAVVSCSLTTSLDGLTTSDDGAEAGAGAGAADGAVGAPADGAAGSTDASSDSVLQDVVAPVVDGCSMAGCFTMPPGFSLVAFGATANGAACPTGYTAPEDTVEGATLGANACSCGCSVTAPPSCATGMLVGHFDVDGLGMCAAPGGNLANTGCGTDGFLGPFSAGNEHEYQPAPASGGACSASANKDASKLTYAAQGRVCQAATMPVCDGKVCPTSAAAPFAVCIGAAGDVACPSGFATKHSLGTSASFTCGAGCTCGVTATCSGKVNYFPTPDCSGAVGDSAIVNNDCHSTNFGGVTYVSHLYVPNAPMNVACTKSGSSTPSTPSLSQPSTVCCN